MPLKYDDTGLPVYFGGSAQGTEILKIDKSDGGSHICNVFPKGRFDIEEAALLSIIVSIGEGDKGTEDFIRYWVATSAGEGGLRIGEYIQLCTGMLLPSAMPPNPGMKPQFGRDGRNFKAGPQTKKVTSEENE